jgi:hypothetical protein
MPFKLQKAHNVEYIECEPSDFIIRDERDVLDLISVCVENDANKVMLYEESLSPEFFDLKTNLAGAV